ncbi:MAG: pyridoxamine 5-phosphate oxidase-related FMN-binding protein [Frankiales bacterium]|jgi:predicted pyridoxine 5'-phosphate oxidase superfamily flavin-nucleotide-binding protein|nr:pyridoxamine 5-phosphate oxidase-related FMN-binding protein [Frankiales bacterium]
MSEHSRPQGRHAVAGSVGEHELQTRFATGKRAQGFYDHQLLDHLNGHMQEFLGRMEMAFIATADAHGEADCSFRAGPPGFVCVLDDKTLVYPEYRGNGVMASLGNITENGHIGLLFIDFCGDAIGLHVNGRASVLENGELFERGNLPPSVVSGLFASGGQRPERWVLVDVVEAYIHCSKHIPQMLKRSDAPPEWGTDDVVKKGGDYFKAKISKREAYEGRTPAAPARVPAPAVNLVPAQRRAPERQQTPPPAPRPAFVP